MSQPPSLPSTNTTLTTNTTTTTTNNNTDVSLLEVNVTTDVTSLNNASAELGHGVSTSTGGRGGTTLSLNRSLSEIHVGSSSTEDYTRQKAEFYQSYNPEIGLHTAAVLGGILGWLIIYLLYKTKVKKWVLSFLRKHCKNRKEKRKEKKAKKKLEAFVEVPDHDDIGSDPVTGASVKNPHPDSEGSAGSQFSPRDQGDRPNPCIQEEGFPVEVMCGPGPAPAQPMPSIVVESCSSLPNSKPLLNTQNIDKPPASDAGSPRHKDKVGKGSEGKADRKKKYRQRKSRGQGCPEVTVQDVDNPATTLLPPPSSRADAAQATARWVQTMPLLNQSHQDVTSLLLKIRPSLPLGSKKKQQSCPLISAALQYAALPLLGGLPHLGLNNSMPHLADNGMGSLKNSRDLLFEDDDQEDHERNQNVQLLQPLPYSAPPASRPQSSQSHVGGASSVVPAPPPPPPRTQLIPARTPPIPSRTPPRLTIVIPPDVTRAMTPSNSSLVVPGPGAWMTSSVSAPTSPVPLPVTPTVTIQNCTPRVSRGRGGGGGRDSEDSGSSSSSLDPLLHLHNDCHCPARPPPSPSPSPSHYLPPSPLARPPHSPLPPSPLARQPPPSPLPSPLPPPSPSPSLTLAKASSQSSWTVFDDDDHRPGGGGGGGEREGTGSGASSRQNCLRFTYPATPGPVSDGSDTPGRAGPQDVGVTLETKL
ncbi:hypothetical protein ACOMHN_028316 [Nucella lapillus]